MMLPLVCHESYATFTDQTTPPYGGGGHNAPLQNLEWTTLPPPPPMANRIKSYIVKTSLAFFNTRITDNFVD